MKIAVCSSTGVLEYPKEDSLVLVAKHTKKESFYRAEMIIENESISVPISAEEYARLLALLGKS